MKVLIERFRGYPANEAHQWDIFKQYFNDHMKVVNGRTATATQVLEKLCFSHSDVSLHYVFPIICILQYVPNHLHTTLCVPILGCILQYRVLPPRVSLH